MTLRDSTNIFIDTAAEIREATVPRDILTPFITLIVTDRDPIIAASTVTEFKILSESISEISFNADTSIFTDTANDMRLSTDLILILTPSIILIAADNDNIIATNEVTEYNTLSESISEISFRADVSIFIAAAKATNVNGLIEIPFIFSISFMDPTNIPAAVATPPTAFNRSSSSISAISFMDLTNIRIAIANPIIVDTKPLPIPLIMLDMD